MGVAPTFAAACLAMLAFATPAHPDQVIFSDDTFDDADWTAQGGTFSVGQVAAGGNPGAYREVMQESGYSGISEVTHFHEGWVYDPAKQGKIHSISFSYDLRKFPLSASDVEEVRYGLVLKQGGWVYRSSAGHEATADEWIAFGADKQTEGQFWVEDFGGPDFSPLGAPIEIGYMSSHFGADTTRSGIDNLTVEIATLPCVPETHWRDGFGQSPDGQGLNGSVRALVEYNGSAVAGGTFTSGGGATLRRIGMWDGTAWIALGWGVNAAVYALENYGGELYAGGAFTESDATPLSYVARWDGVGWQPLGLGLNGEVRALLEFNGELYAGGSFTTAGGVPARRVARWDGVDWHPLGDGFDASVNDLTVYEGKIVAGGFFSSADGQAARRLAMWDGVAWSEFGGGASSVVHALAVFDDELFVGGDFDSVGAMSANGIATWDGATWTVLGDGVDGSVRALTPYNDTIVAAGAFEMAGVQPLSRVGRWTGEEWLPLEDGVDGTARAAATIAGSLMLGGDFVAAGPLESEHLAQWGDGTDGVNHVPEEFSRIAVAASTAFETDVVVAPGQYDEVPVLTSTTPRYVTIRGCGDPSETRLGGLDMSAGWGLTLEGLTFAGPVNFYTEEFFRLSNCQFDDMFSGWADGYLDGPASQADSCIFTGPASLRTSLRSIYVSNSRALSGLSVQPMTEGSSLVSDCWVQGDLQLEADDYNSAQAVRCSVMLGDLTIFNDDFDFYSPASATDCTILGGDLIVYSDDRSTAQGNVVDGQIRVSGGSRENSHIGVQGNVVHGPGSGIVVDYDDDLADADVSSNTVSNTSTGIWIRGADFDNAEVVVERNILAVCSLGVRMDRNTPAIAAIVACNNFWDNEVPFAGGPDPLGVDGNITARPWFCDPTGGDYTLSSQSPCLPGNHPDGVDCGLIGALGQGCTLLGDLVAPEVLCSPDTTFWSGEGDSVAIGAVVTNSGLFPSEPSFVRIEVTGCIGFYGDTRPIAELQPGESDTAWVGPFAADLVACEVDVTVDFFDDVVEGDEGNNAVVGATPCTVVGTEDSPEVVAGPLRLRAPNPWRADGQIAYRGAGAERLEIYDVGGRLVRSWNVEAGGGSLVWDGRDGAGRAVRSGRYFLRLVGASGAVTRTLTILR